MRHLCSARMLANPEEREQLPTGGERCRIEITDYSQHGLSLDRATGVELDERVTVELASGRRLPMRVAWVKGTAAGVRFVGPIMSEHGVMRWLDEAVKVQKRRRRRDLACRRTAPTHRLVDDGSFPSCARASDRACRRLFLANRNDFQVAAFGRNTINPGRRRPRLPQEIATRLGHVMPRSLRTRRGMRGKMQLASVEFQGSSTAPGGR